MRRHLPFPYVHGKSRATQDAHVYAAILNWKRNCRLSYKQTSWRY